MKKGWNLIKWVLLLGYFPVMLAFVSANHRSTICSNVKVIVKDSLDIRFVSGDEIRTSVLRKYPDMLGYVVKNLNFNEIEDFVNRHSAVSRCEVFETVQGVVYIEVKQHKPMLRVFAADGTYYLDRNGLQIPVFKNFSARTLVVNGAVSKEDRIDLLNVGRLITEDEFWSAQIEQIYIRKNNEYVLVPRVGDHWILLGQPINVDIKLRNLRALYTDGLLPKEWNDFKLINLKYENQVLCSKNRNL